MNDVIDQVVADPAEIEAEPKLIEAEKVAEGSTEPTEADKAAAAEARAKRSRDRYDQLHREKEEAERKAAFWRDVAEKKEEKPAEKPVRTDFADDFAFIEALTDWKTEAATTRIKADLAQEGAKHARQEAANTTAQTYAERAKQFAAETPDFDDVLDAASGVFISEAAHEALLDCDTGPRIAYHFAKPENAEEAKRFNAMTPAQQVRAIGRLEATFSASKKDQPKPPTSRTPAPINPIRGSGGQFVKDESAIKDANEWATHYRKTYRSG